MTILTFRSQPAYLRYSWNAGTQRTWVARLANLEIQATRRWTFDRESKQAQPVLLFCSARLQARSNTMQLKGDWVMIRTSDGPVNLTSVRLHRATYECPVDVAAGFEGGSQKNLARHRGIRRVPVRLRWQAWKH